ncbi:MAG: DUF4345 family protein [Pseudomonadaceae bacterium]|nr:DUF4345 family protein [Pseudomonadaceae bacterium]
MATILRVLLVLLAGFFLLMGVYFVSAPMAAQELFAIEPVGSLGLNTIRGDLGGLFLAFGAFAGLGLRKPSAAWLPALAVIMLTIALGRVTGLIVDGFNSQAVVLLAVEVATAALALGAHRLLPDR